MIIFPAIDIYEGKAVRLFKGDYKQLTVYSDSPASVALDFKKQGASAIHVVDLEGAKDGTTPNFDIVKEITEKSRLFVEVGGGIRSLEVIEKYVDAGVGRVILGTAALTDRDFLKEALRCYGDKIAVGVDIRDGFVAIKGWVENSNVLAFDFLKELDELGVRTVIATDISKDGAMQGANRELYCELSKTLSMNIIASGGVSSIEDVESLSKMGLYGAIIGKAYYTGALSLTEAIEVAK